MLFKLALASLPISQALAKKCTVLDPNRKPLVQPTQHLAFSSIAKQQGTSGTPGACCYGYDDQNTIAIGCLVTKKTWTTVIVVGRDKVIFLTFGTGPLKTPPSYILPIRPDRITADVASTQTIRP
ncbi:hypothetical protein IE53DRAFT_411527 [Violaceomyces palustris]|uniref:Uncharacterized protein n=1 Tax=Violaceomyces palustris TaxID=1673888 RepID=A0ACD0NV20_9BASI|nr:hypothetical protein IE53DRAFT_411527 [Violaceomyces palustris]